MNEAEIEQVSLVEGLKKFRPPQFSHTAARVFYCDRSRVDAKCLQSMRRMSGMPAESYSGAGCQQILEGELLEGFR